MKHILISVISLLFVLQSSSQTQKFISAHEAELIAHKCIVEKSPIHLKSDLLDLQILDVKTVKTNSIDIFHIVNFKPAGFVIISAAKTWFPVIAFGFDRNFEYPVTAPAVNMWLENEEKKITYSLKQPQRHPKIADAWSEYDNNHLIYFSAKNERIVQPMLTTEWNQGTYYNEFCPPDPSGPDKKTYAGCVATAIGQVMNYFRYPLTGTGTYTSEYLVYGVHTVDYDNATYSWNEMPLKLTRSNHPVAELLYHIGVSVDMNYGPNGSGMWNHKAAHTMSTFFGYTDSTQYNFRDTTTIDWNGMLIDHLDRGIVLYYAGWADSQYVSGHAFVCDGYQDSTFFHFNWGWGGSWDGYFHIDNLMVGGADFTTMHEAVINGTPATNYPYYCTGTDTLRTIDGTIEDGSGPVYDYLNNSACSWLIMPDDTLSHITLSVIKLDLHSPGDVVRVYDGTNSSAPLLAEITGNSHSSDVVSTGKTMFVDFQSDNNDVAGGFLFSWTAQQVKTCSGITTLTDMSGTITDGSGPYNYQNLNICRWRIEPPDAEFFHLNFSEFDIDTSDYVRITNLANNSTIAEFTGNQIPADINVWTSKIMVILSSNHTGNAQGFTLHYNASAQSISEIASDQISVYPNPASEFVTIDLNAHLPQGTIIINILGITGQLIEHFEFDTSQKQFIINTEHLQSGLYILNINIPGGTQINKKLSVVR